MRIHHLGVGVEHIASGPSRPQCAFNFSESRTAGIIHGDVMPAWFADDQSAHEGRVIMAVDSGKFQRELITFRQFATAPLVTDEKSIATGANDELVGGVITTTREDGRVLRSKNVALVGSCLGLL